MLLDDVVRLCGVLANHGFVLQGRNADRPLPEVGLCVRFKKSWVWMPSDAWKRDARGPAGAPSQYKTSLPPGEAYGWYHKLLVRRNFQ